MTRVCHLFDRSIGWEQRVSAGQLLGRLPPDRFSQILTGTDGHARSALAPLGHVVDVVPQRSILAPLAGLGRYLDRQHVDLIHAWGIRAARCARSACRSALVVTCFDPRLSHAESRTLRAVADRPYPFAVVCASQHVRRRLVEGGVPPQACVVLRPAVDFAAITTARRGPLRDELSISRQDFMVVVPEPLTRAGGQIEAVWALIVAGINDPFLKVVLPGGSRERERIRRLAALGLERKTVICPAVSPAFEELVSAADALLVAARGDTSVTSAAWAMAAETVVIGCAGHSLAELITHKHNGLLFKRDGKGETITKIAVLLADRQGHVSYTEAARGQAYSVFGLRRFVDQHVQLYGNLLTGRPAAEGIVDSAVIGQRL